MGDVSEEALRKGAALSCSQKVCFLLETFSDVRQCSPALRSISLEPVYGGDLDEVCQMLVLTIAECWQSAMRAGQLASAMLQESTLNLEGFEV